MRKDRWLIAAWLSDRPLSVRTFADTYPTAHFMRVDDKIYPRYPLDPYRHAGFRLTVERWCRRNRIFPIVFDREEAIKLYLPHLHLSESQES